MFWKLFRLQELLDALFDEGWFSLGLTLEGQGHEDADAPLQPHQA